MKLLPMTIKGLSASMLSGAATDPIMDNLMITANTKANEEFNMLTNVLFDATIFSAGETLA